MFPDDHAGEAAPQAFPWNTAPTGLGSSRCGWCGREIYLPALPCSTRPADGLLEMATAPGLGDRCKWELTTRVAAISGTS